MDKKVNMNQHLLDTVPIPVFWINREGKVVYANAAAVQSLGYSHKKTLQLSIFDFDSFFTKSDWSKTVKKLFSRKLKKYESTQQRRHDLPC